MAFEALKRIIGGGRTRDPVARIARAHYRTSVEAARRPGFYRDWGVPDTVDGRFDMLALHVFLALRHLRTEAGERSPLAQRIFDVMFRDLDDQLRELGVGDLKVTKKVRAMAEDFMGRVAAYDTALATGDAAALTAALARNVYEDETADAAALSAYVLRTDKVLATQNIGEGALSFPPLEHDRGA